jgi:hypothetical protein
MFLVAVSGWGQEDDKRRASEAGFDRDVTKPVEFARLEDWCRGASCGPP